MKQLCKDLIFFQCEDSYKTQHIKIHISPVKLKKKTEKLTCVNFFST